MSEHEALIAAIRAEESAKGAHHRLDRMNGSIDRLGTAVIDIKSELSTKLDGVLLQLAATTGFEKGQTSARNGFLESRRFVITTMVALAVGLVGSVATLVWLAVSG